ncbi:zinc finger protein 883-like isoform X2 [Cimex lectularius]|uniref:C2H2-type domain-containing protein n=1 Tax=Cimex lectularius TaxID=79782 RepID=A0A8I6TLZ2_CIMLE|nr:zinc finger protein 883-like isoform X2 [Cimex lectularius]
MTFGCFLSMQSYKKSINLLSVYFSQGCIYIVLVCSDQVIRHLIFVSAQSWHFNCNFMLKLLTTILKSGPGYPKLILSQTETHLYLTTEYVGGEKSKKGEHKQILEVELDRSSSGLNIQAEECMPPRGELSGHGSLGDTGPENIWIRDELQSQFIGVPGPLWDESKDTKKKYMCLYCEQEFNCPKERRVHVATLHCNQDSKQGIKKTIMCTKCGLHLSTQKELKVHTRTEHKKISRQCGVCMQVFPTQELFVEHIIKIHPLECRTCGKTFHSKSSLHTHAKIHLDLKPHACSLCPKSFISNQKLKEHMNGHTGYAPIQCNLCDRRFKRYSNLKQHKDSAHFQIKKKVKEYFCECGETFISKKKLDWHRETHEEKPKQCMYCSERYIHNASLTRHIRKAHNREYLPEGEDIKKKNVSCPICSQIFIESSLRAHMKQHGNVKQFGCIVCGKKFLTKWNLHLHKWTHASRISKPFKCTMCKGAFIRQSDFQAHIRAHYGNKPFTCNHCGMQFNRKHNWLRHEKEHSSEKRYTCDECGKTFHRNYYLVDHLRIHTGIKPFSCHICNKTSSTKSNHNKHIKTHHAREAINTES